MIQKIHSEQAGLLTPWLCGLRQPPGETKWDLRKGKPKAAQCRLFICKMPSFPHHLASISCSIPGCSTLMVLFRIQHRTTEHPEWEETHKGHETSPGPCIDSPTIPPESIVQTLLESIPWHIHSLATLWGRVFS